MSRSNGIILLSNKRSLKWHVTVTVVHLHLLAHRAHAVLVEVAILKATTTLLNKPALKGIHLLKQVVVPGTMLEGVRYEVPMLTSVKLTAVANTGKTVNYSETA